MIFFIPSIVGNKITKMWREASLPSEESKTYLKRCQDITKNQDFNTFFPEKCIFPLPTYNSYILPMLSKLALWFILK